MSAKLDTAIAVIGIYIGKALHRVRERRWL
jgi:hypothetical protein